jgi:hypothetical protein
VTLTKKQNKFISEKTKISDIQKQILINKNTEVVNSIIYAQKIQQSFMPSELSLIKQLKRLKNK